MRLIKLIGNHLSSAEVLCQAHRDYFMRMIQVRRGSFTITVTLGQYLSSSGHILQVHLEIIADDLMLIKLTEVHYGLSSLQRLLRPFLIKAKRMLIGNLKARTYNILWTQLWLNIVRRVLPVSRFTLNTSTQLVLKFINKVH